MSKIYSVQGKEGLPPHFILAVMPPEGQTHLENLVNNHLSQCVACQAWKVQHPGSTWRRFVSRKAYS